MWKNNSKKRAYINSANSYGAFILKIETIPLWNSFIANLSTTSVFLIVKKYY